MGINYKMEDALSEEGVCRWLIRRLALGSVPLGVFAVESEKIRRIWSLFLDISSPRQKLGLGETFTQAPSNKFSHLLVEQQGLHDPSCSTG